MPAADIAERKPRRLIANPVRGAWDFAVEAGKAGTPLRRVGHRYGFDQAPGVGVARVAKDLVARAHLDDLAEIHDGDAVGDVFYHRHVMRDEEIGDAELALQFLEQLQHARLDRHVKRRHAFVGDDQLRPQRERAGDADALPLAAREFVRVILHLIG